jgi:hypothetical protein
MVCATALLGDVVSMLNLLRAVDIASLDEIFANLGKEV